MVTFLLILFVLIFNSNKCTQFTDVTTTITCPTTTECRIICNARGTCSDIVIYCINSDHGCYLHCNTTACHNTQIYFTNVFKSEIICDSESCHHSEIYIKPKNSSSTVFMDLQSSKSMDTIHISPYNTDTSFTNDQNISILPITNNVSIPIYPITILCHQTNSCQNTSFQLEALQYFKLYCLSDYSCQNTYIDFISHNNDTRGRLNLECFGNSACVNANINAITAQEFKMFCNRDSNSCSSTMIQCPINVFLTDAYEHSCIIHCESSNSCMDSIIYAMYGEIQLNSVSDKLNVSNLQMHCGFSFNETCTVGQNCESKCAVPPQQGSMQMVLPFQTNVEHLHCNIYDRCMVFMNSNIAQSVDCHTSTQCIVVCMGLNCGENAVINGSNANVLILQSSMDSNFALTNVYGPMNGEFLSNAQLIDTRLYLTDTANINIHCSNPKICKDISIFANDTHSLTIQCNESESCHSILAYINATEPLYCTRIDWYCYDGCVANSNQLLLNNDLECVINSFHSQTYCNEVVLSQPCNIPITSTTHMSVNTTFTNKETKNSMTAASIAGILAIALLILCCVLCCVGLFVAKRKILQKEILQTQTKNSIVHVTHEEHKPRKDTVGSTIEDIIKDSTAVQFTNPLDVLNENIDIHRNHASISAMPPLNIDMHKLHKESTAFSEDEHKDEEKQIELFVNENVIVYSADNNNRLHSDRHTITIEGSMEMDDRLCREMDIPQSHSRGFNTPNTNTNTTQSVASSFNIEKHRNFRSPSLEVLSIYEEKNRNNSRESSDSNSDELYESVSSQRNEGGNDTTQLQGQQQKSDNTTSMHYLHTSGIDYAESN